MRLGGRARVCVVVVGGGWCPTSLTCAVWLLLPAPARRVYSVSRLRSSECCFLSFFLPSFFPAATIASISSFRVLVGTKMDDKETSVGAD